MRKFALLSLIVVFLLAACGAAAATEAPAQPAATEAPAIPFLITITPEVAPFVPPIETQAALTQPVEVAPGAVPSPTKTLIPTLTPFPTATKTVLAPTETLLPPLELPTERAFAPSRVAWTGLPTYPGDSDPGLLFRVDYDPDVWAQTEGNFGDIVLGHRLIPYCTITPWTGRGLPAGTKVEHDFRTIGSADFDVITVTQQGDVKFVAYVGGDRHILTGFQVSFEERQDQCIQDAELIFATLRSLAAIPTATPTIVVEPPTPINGLNAIATPTP
jgi:hypothetical protein